MKDKRTSKTEGVFFTDDSTKDTKTLDAIFDLYRKGERELAKLKTDLDKRVVEEQARYKKKKFLEIEEEVKEAELAGVTDVERLRARLQKEAIEEDFKRRLDSQNKLYKKELEDIKNKNKSLTDRVSENLSKYKENREQLQLYKKIVDSGGTLTIQQQQDKETREREQKKLNNESTMMQIQKGLINALQGLSDSVNSTMRTYTELQRGTNARLQGFNVNATGLEQFMFGKNQTFGILENRLTSAVGVTPFFKTETMLTNLSNLINEGIASNVEQRAFLQTASENIANTFDVANSTLLRIIRLQQSDSSAARLGMEASLTNFLNRMFENTEYLNQTFDNVSDALVETYSHMSIEMSTELEYIVQKWLGSLVSVGFSESTATSIAQALGYLGSGNVEALSNNNLQNLLAMSASKGSLSYSGLLTSGLNATDANILLGNLVTYLAEIEKSGNNVVKSQLASTFGISFSDLAAAANLASSMSDISSETLSFEGMYSALGQQLGDLPSRMNAALMIDTLWQNLEFGLGSNIASNPALAAIWKVTDLIQQNTGGINLPFLSAAGFGMDLNTTAENLIKLGLVGTSSLGMIGDVISGIQSTVSPVSILSKLGISSSETAISRGSGLSSFSSGLSTSQSTVQQVGQGSGESIYESAVTSAKQEARQSPEAYNKEDEKIQKAPLNIYEYLVGTFDTRMKDLVDYANSVESKLDDIYNKVSNGVS